MGDDREILVAQRHGQRIDVVGHRRVVLVFHGGGDDPRRRRGHERIDRRPAPRLQHTRQPPALALDAAGIDVGDLGHCLRRRQQTHIRGRRGAHQRGLEARIQRDVTHRLALRAPAETGHVMLNVGKKALAAHFAIVHQVEARRDLRIDNRVGRGLDLLFERLAVDRLAPEARAVQGRQGPWPRQAAGVGRENALRHVWCPRAIR